MQNANDALRHHNCTDGYYRFNYGLITTSGVKALAEMFKAFWLLDVIASYQPQLKNEEFQVWRLKRFDDDSAIVKCEDGNGKRLVMQEVPFTDFSAGETTIWVESGVALLPSEH